MLSQAITSLREVTLTETIPSSMGQSAVGNYVHQFAGKVTDDIENKVADRVATQVVDEVKNTALGALGLNSTAQLTSTLHGLLGYYLPLLGDSIASSLPQSQQQQQRTRSSTSYPTGSVSSSTTTTSSGNTQTTSSTGSTTSTASASPTAVSATASSVAMDGTEAFTNGSSSAGAMAYSNGSDTGTNGTASSVDLQALYDNFLLQQKPQQATNVQRQAEDMPSLAGDGSGARINAQVRVAGDVNVNVNVNLQDPAATASCACPCSSSLLAKAFPILSGSSNTAFSTRNPDVSVSSGSLPKLNAQLSKDIGTMIGGVLSSSGISSSTATSSGISSSTASSSSSGKRRLAQRSAATAVPTSEHSSSASDASSSGGSHSDSEAQPSLYHVLFAALSEGISELLVSHHLSGAPLLHSHSPLLLQRLDRPSSSRTLLEQEDPVAMGITTTAVPARGSTHSGSSNSNVNPGLGSKAAAQQTGSFMGGRLFNTQACSCPCSG
ncbi:MAG: hypothetical protein WDW38_004565 [Sanguina aurantia]